MDNKNHWEQVYESKSPDSVSWYQEHPETSLRLIRQLEPRKSARIIDVGGGASTLVDDLLAIGYDNLAVLDISATALHTAKKRLGERAADVDWIAQDVTRLVLPRHSIDVWHDRAVFHFLTDEADRKRYVDVVLHSVRPGGHVIVSTFAEDGPERCSGLLVRRYNEASLHGEFGTPFALLGHENETHQTPAGGEQQFVYCFCRVNHD